MFWKRMVFVQQRNTGHGFCFVQEISYVKCWEQSNNQSNSSSPYNQTRDIFEDIQKMLKQVMQFIWFSLQFYMNRQTVVLLVMVLAITSKADTISKQLTSLSPSSVTANVPSTLALEPQIPSNNKPQPFKGPTVESLPAVQPVILNNTVELRSDGQISKKQEAPTSLNSTTTIGEEIPKSVDAALLKTNKTGSQQQQAQPITVVDAKVSKGETAFQVIEKSEKQVSNDDKLQRQAIQQKKARQSLPKDNNTEMVKVQSEITPSVAEKPKDVEKVIANIEGTLNISQNINYKKGLLQNMDNKTAENTIITKNKQKQIKVQKQKTPQQVIVIDIAKVDSNNKTITEEDVDTEDQLQVQNKTETHQETSVKLQNVEQKTQPSNEIKIIPLDNEQDQSTQEDQDDEEGVEPQKTPTKEKPLPKDGEELVVKQNAPSKENKTVNAKKEPTETQQKTLLQQQSAAKTQTTKETIVQTKQEETAIQKDMKKKTNEQKDISIKKQPVEQRQNPKEKQQPNKPKEDVSQAVARPKEKVVQEKKQPIETNDNIMTNPNTAKEVEIPATQSPKSDITKSSDKEDKPQEHVSNLRRQQQPKKPVIEKDINEVQSQKHEDQEEPKQNTVLEKQQSKKADQQQSLQQLLEEVKSDLSKDAKTKIIQHLENQIKEQEAGKITILEEKPGVQYNQYLQLQSSSPRQGAKQPEKEGEVSSEEIMDTKTVIVIIILTFIISIPIVREIKSKDSQVKESKDKMENDLKESSQTLGLEFSQLDNETGYGEPLDQEER